MRLTKQCRYYRRLHGIPLDVPVRLRTSQEGKACEVNDCAEPACCKGLCKYHYHKNRSKHGIDGPLDKSWANDWWKLRGKCCGWPRYCEVVRRKELRESQDRQCTKCGERKSKTQFAMHSGVKAGKKYYFQHSRCKECMGRARYASQVRKKIATGVRYRTREEIQASAKLRKEKRALAKQRRPKDPWGRVCNRQAAKLGLEPQDPWDKRCKNARQTLRMRPPAVRKSTSIANNKVSTWEAACNAEAWKLWRVVDPWEVKIANTVGNLRKRRRRRHHKSCASL